MTVNRTTLLDLPLPVTGTEDGTWGDVTNNALTQYLDIAIAGMVSLTSSDFIAGDLTIALTEGDSSATNIANSSAQYSAIRVSSLAQNSTITAPSSNRAYKVINADATYTLTIKATGQTGVTFAPGTTGIVAFNGTDYAILGVVGPASATDNAVVRFDGTTGRITQNSVVTIADSTGDISGVGALSATGATFSGLTASQAVFTNGSKALVSNAITGTGNVVMSTSPTLVTPALGTPASGTLTNATGLPLSTGVTGTLPHGNGGTGQTTFTDGELLIGKTDGSLAKATLTAGSNVTITNGDGTIEIASTGGGGGGGGTSVTVTQVTATAAQTDFSVTYTVGQLSVYLNGALLASADFTATNGTTVVLAAGAAVNDIFTALAYSTVAGLDIESASPFMTAVGSGAGAVNTGVNNVFVGFEAGNDNTSGTNNTALGYQALDVNTTAGSNTAVGSGALGVNTGAENTAVGAFALDANTTGIYNTALGVSALGANTTSTRNTALGYASLSSNTTGEENVAVGRNALLSHTGGSFNVAVGHGSMANGNGGSNNAACGYEALQANTGSNNTAVGYRSLLTNTTGADNTAVGRDALNANTTGAGNTAVGYGALDANTTGAQNVALGLNALGSNTVTNGNTGIGFGALASAQNSNVGEGAQTAVGLNSLTARTTGTQNTAVGVDAGRYGTTGSFCTFMGYRCGESSNGNYNSTYGGFAGASLSTGESNTFLGAQAGHNFGSNNTTTGSYNTFVGAFSRGSGNATTNEIAIGYNAQGKGSDTAFIAGSSGAYNGNNSSSWQTTSDQRLKKNIVDNTEGLGKINGIRVRNFEYRAEDEITDFDGSFAINKEGVQLGVVAQELQQVCPDCVVEQSTGVLSVNTDEVFWHMVSAIKELSAKCDSLQAEINTLKGQ